MANSHTYLGRIIENKSVDQNGLITYSYTRKGSKTAIDNYVENTLLPAGYIISSWGLTGNGDECEVTWKYPDEESKSDDVWEFEPLPMRKDILQSNNPLVLALGATNRYLLENAINDIAALKDSNYAPQVDPASTAEEIEAFNQIWNLLSAGVRTLPILGCVLRVSYNCGQDYVLDDTTYAIGGIHSNDTMIAVELVPIKYWNVLYNQFPTGPYETVSGGNAPKLLTWNYGWKKGGPKIVVTSGGKTQVSVEYEYGLYAEESDGPLI